MERAGRAGGAPPRLRDAGLACEAELQGTIDRAGGALVSGVHARPGEFALTLAALVAFWAAVLWVVL